jgi:translation initiation factor 3 subunit C
MVGFNLSNVMLTLSRRIQEEGLRTYLFTYAPYYTSLSLPLLSRTFHLDLRAVTSIVSRMIWNEELSASLDQAAGVVVFHRIELTRTQQLAQILADKVSLLVDQNEKSLDVKLAGSTGWGDRAEGAKGDKREQVQERRGRDGRLRGGSTRGKVI